MNKNIILKNLGIAVATMAFGLGIIHRFLHPDITDIRWIIDYWYIELATLIFVSLGLFVWFRNSE